VSTRNIDPGLVLTADSSTIVVSCGRDALSLRSLQRAGAKRLPVSDFQRGSPLEVGARFDLTDSNPSA
jgi:methionyl-tRNA formyltransferase